MRPQAGLQFDFYQTGPAVRRLGHGPMCMKHLGRCFPPIEQGHVVHQGMPLFSVLADALKLQFAVLPLQAVQISHQAFLTAMVF